MGRPLKIYTSYLRDIVATASTKPAPALFHFQPLHFITSLDSCRLHTLSTSAFQLLTPQALTYPFIPQRGPFPWLLTFLSLCPFLPSPSDIPSYLSQSWAAALSTDARVARHHPLHHPVLSSYCVPIPGVSILGQLLGLCGSSLNPSPLHQIRQLLYPGFGFQPRFYNCISLDLPVFPLHSLKLLIFGAFF